MWTVVEIEEDQFHDFSAIYGCGPAFLLKIFASFSNHSAAFAWSKKEQRDQLSLLLKWTLAFLDAHPEEDIPALISKVASRGGVTQAWLEVLDEQNIDNLLSDVFQTASRRSQELSG